MLERSLKIWTGNQLNSRVKKSRVKDECFSGKEALKRNEDVLKPRDPKLWQKIENMIIGEDGKPTIKKPDVKPEVNVNQVRCFHIFISQTLIRSWKTY